MITDWWTAGLGVVLVIYGGWQLWRAAAGDRGADDD